MWRGEKCPLLYQHGQKFENGCDSRQRLIKDNQTVFLHLSDVMSVDSGNYSCECSHAHGTETLHINITVQGTFRFIVLLQCFVAVVKVCNHI